MCTHINSIHTLCVHTTAVLTHCVVTHQQYHIRCIPYGIVQVFWKIMFFPTQQLQQKRLQWGCCCRIGSVEMGKKHTNRLFCTPRNYTRQLYFNTMFFLLAVLDHKKVNQCCIIRQNGGADWVSATLWLFCFRSEMNIMEMIQLTGICSVTAVIWLKSAIPDWLFCYYLSFSDTSTHQ